MVAERTVHVPYSAHSPPFAALTEPAFDRTSPPTPTRYARGIFDLPQRGRYMVVERTVHVPYKALSTS